MRRNNFKQKENLNGYDAAFYCSLYRCSDGELWTLPYTLNGQTGTTSVFRVENVEGYCATCRCLAPNPETTSDTPYVGTDSFFTINLNCVGALTCLADTYIGCA